MELTYEMIHRARMGEQQAMDAIVNHYAGYIHTISKVTVPIDENHKITFYDAEIDELIRAELMIAILQRKENRSERLQQS